MHKPPFPVSAQAWFSPGFVRSLTLEERGFYFEMLLISWDDDGIAAERIEDPTELCRFFRFTKPKFHRLWGVIRSRFQQDLAGRWRNPRQELARKLATPEQELPKSSAKGSQKLARKLATPEQEQLPNTAETATSDTSTRARTFSLSSLREEDQIQEKKKERDPGSDIVRYFELRWTAELNPGGRAPKITQPDAIQLQKLQREFGAQEVRRLVDRYLADRDPFIVRNGHSARYLPSRVNAYLSTAKPEDGRRPDPLYRPPPRPWAVVKAEEEAMAESLRRQREEQEALEAREKGDELL